MRILGFYLVAVAALTVVSEARGQQPSAVQDKNGEHRTEVKDFPPPPPPENWGSLDDTKTGLFVPAAEVVQKDDQPGFARELVRVQWRLGDPIDLWITRPKTSAKVPVILYLYNYTNSNDLFHDNGWCQRASSDGFAAVGFVSAVSDYRFKTRPLKQWFVSELPEAVGSSVHDVQLILNYLAGRGDMDMDHVGMFGMGSGASIAILAAHADPRIKALDVLDPWADWPAWLELSPVVPSNQRPKYLGLDFLKAVSPLDPLAYLPTLKTPSFRLQQLMSDPVTPVNIKERLASAAPKAAQVVKYAKPEELLKAWQVSGLSGWMKTQLRPQKPKETAQGAGN